MSKTGRTAIAVSLIVSIAAAALAAFMVFGERLPPFVRMPVTDADYGPPHLRIESIEFSELHGWRRDDQTAAIEVFLRSCARLDSLADDAPANSKEALGEALGGISLSGVARDWRAACAAARSFAEARYADQTAAASAARALFEFHFRPIKIISVRTPLPDGRARGRSERVAESGLFTGYFEPSYSASTFRTATHTAPVLTRPDNLVMADLGEFRSDLAGERIAGYVDGGVLRPYPDRAALAQDGAPGADTLGWLAPNDHFFLQIQGSGRLRLQNGKSLRVGYDGHNGHPYTAIGRVLVERGALTLENVTMQTIREWMENAPPDEAEALRNANASFVFFRELDDLPDPDLGPVGSEGVQLTPARSIAVDQRFHTMGAPIWVSIPEEDGRTPPINRLFVAQDTGGAIRGPLRGDIFLGSGDRAGEAAGRLRAMGEMAVLVPAAVAARLASAGVLDRSAD